MSGGLYPYLRTGPSGPLNPDLLADIASGLVAPGTAVATAAYYQNSTMGGAQYVAVPANTGTDDGGSLITVGTLQLKAAFGDGASLYQFGARDGTDVTTTLQRFLDYTFDNFTPVARLDGTYPLSAGVTWGRPTGTAKTTTYDGRLMLTATAPIEVMVTVQNFGLSGALNFQGEMRLIGTGGLTYTSRTCGIGLRVTNSVGCYFRKIDCAYFYYDGVQITDTAGNQNMTTFDMVRGVCCGSGGSNAFNHSLLGNWSNPVNVGSASGLDQRTTLTVDTNLPTMTPGLERGPNLVLINGCLYWVTNRAPGTVTVFPWLDPTAGTAGMMRYVTGAALKMSGSDGGETSARLVFSQNSGAGVASTSLYGCDIDRVVAENCHIGFVFGDGWTAAHIHSRIGSLYCESNNFDVVQVCGGGGEHGVQIGGYVLDPAKVVVLNSRSSAGTITPIRAGFLAHYGYNNGTPGLRPPLKEGSNYNTGSVVVDLTDTPYPRMFAAGTAGLTIQVATPNLDFNRLMGYDSQTVTVFGTGPGYAPTSAIKIAAPAGWTVNGAPTVSFSGFTGPPTFHLYLRVAARDIQVHKV